MAAFGGQSKPENQNSNFERVTFPQGIYQNARLDKAFLKKTEPTDFAPEGKVKAFFIFMVPDADGNEWEIMTSENLPKNLAYNEKAGFWKLMSGAAGTPINNENIEGFQIEFDNPATSMGELLAACEQLDPKNGKTQRIPITSVKWESKELMGALYTLVLSVWQRNGKEGNNIDNVIPAQAQQAAKPRFNKPSVPAGMP